MLSCIIFRQRILFVTISSFLIILVSECKEVSENDNMPGSHDTCSFTVQNIVMHRVSDLLLGFNVVYPHEKDQIWEDGKIAGFLKDVQARLIRYPGGTVASFYHWNTLSGNGWVDSFDPENKLVNQSATEFMDVDEYMALIRKTGATPLIGINMSSAWRWNRTEEGIAEALALMKYCRNKNFDVKYWYLDNEPYQQDSNGGSKTPEEYAALINEFVSAMKEYDPQIQIIANWNAGFTNKRAEYEKLIKQAGKNIDIIDVHWYWGWKQPDQMDKWLSESPMKLWTKNSYINEIADFHQMVIDFGFPGIKLASFEWNVGPGNGTEDNLTEHQSALIQSEMLMQFIIGGLDMAVFWPLHWLDKNFQYRGLINTDNNSTQPNFRIFKFMGGIQGNNLLKTEASQKITQTMYLAGMNENNDTLKICFLNKNPFKVQVNVNSDLFNKMTLQEMNVYVLKNSGKDSELQLLKPLSEKNTGLQFLSPEVSLTMITYVKK